MSLGIEQHDEGVTLAPVDVHFNSVEIQRQGAIPKRSHEADRRRALFQHIRKRESEASHFLISQFHNDLTHADEHQHTLESLLADPVELLSEMQPGSFCESFENDILPSTPLTDEQMKYADSVLKEELDGVAINKVEGDSGDEDYWNIMGLMINVAEQAEEFAVTMWHKLQSWKVIHFSSLPQWLQDNDYLHFGHRPPLPTSLECFKSIFRIHTETGNIWTHLLGLVAFFGLTVYFLTRPAIEIVFQEKLVFSAFFAGAIVCMGLSFAYHTLQCHENRQIGRLFAKFDYCGIAFLTVGSFVPWLHYSFYCHLHLQLIYLIVCVVLGFGTVVVSTFDFFAGPKFRPLRAGLFIFLGLSGVAPATHFGVVSGWEKAVNQAAIGWLILMGALYITGAVLYAVRIPERFFPGKVDIWFHSHQIFHCFVIAGAFVHYHGISKMALYRLEIGECNERPSKFIDAACILSSLGWLMDDTLSNNSEL